MSNINNINSNNSQYVNSNNKHESSSNKSNKKDSDPPGNSSDTKIESPSLWAILGNYITSSIGYNAGNIKVSHSPQIKKLENNLESIHDIFKELSSDRSNIQSKEAVDLFHSVYKEHRTFIDENKDLEINNTLSDTLSDSILLSNGLLDALKSKLDLDLEKSKNGNVPDASSFFTWIPSYFLKKDNAKDNELDLLRILETIKSNLEEIKSETNENRI